MRQTDCEGAVRGTDADRMVRQTERMRDGYDSKSGDASRYDDIIGLPRHVSKVHPQMPLSERAAQFAPFAALSGHGDAIKETQRQMEERMEHEYD